jgi:hypothetical protein
VFLQGGGRCVMFLQPMQHLGLTGDLGFDQSTGDVGRSAGALSRFHSAAPNEPAAASGENLATEPRRRLETEAPTLDPMVPEDRARDFAVLGITPVGVKNRPTEPRDVRWHAQVLAGLAGGFGGKSVSV